MRVEFPRRLREVFPIGTQFMATVKVCQKTNTDGSLRGREYLKASDISIILDSVKDQGLIAKVKESSISGLTYEYIWKDKIQSQI